VATIRTTCPLCGDVELRTGDVVVRVCSATHEGVYEFCCPDCRQPVIKPAQARIVDLLVSSGVRLSIWDPPAELLERHDGPPISYDDLLDFHFALHEEGWLPRMIAQESDDPRR